VEVCEQLREVQPDLSFCLMTPKDCPDSSLSGWADRLQTPFTLPGLRACLARLQFPQRAA